MSKTQTQSQQWVDDLIRPDDKESMLHPVIGVKIECRIAIRTSDDWAYVEEILDACRQYGSAEIVEQKTFDS